MRTGPGGREPRAKNDRSRIPALLKELESFYGKQEPSWPTDPYLFLVWWHCGYPASDATCAKGWHALNQEIGAEPRDILAASPSKLAKPLRAGGMVPNVRARRLHDIAARVTDEFGGDLAAALKGPADRARKILKTFLASPIPAPTACCCGVASPPSRPSPPIVRTSSPEFNTGQRATTTAAPTVRPSRQSKRKCPARSRRVRVRICS